ncbi:MAG: hypothetical protein GX173_07550 [Ruminococcaceae bacterium]|nr:hypothetical protein [Oscillospiraceae bacterium]
MKLEGKLFKGNLLVQVASVEQVDHENTFTAQLESCLIALCRTLDIPIPIWMKKNTWEFARFHQTIFFAEQFTEKIHFDRFQIHWLD